MHIAVFGATDRVGKSVVVKLVEQNHTVTAFEHDENPFINHPNIRIVQGDVSNASDVARALEGVDAVISTMGTWRKSTATAAAMSSILTNMEERGIWRIVVLANVVARIENDSVDFIDRWVYKFYKFLIPSTLREYEDQIRFLQSSKADWTIIRVSNIRRRGSKGAWRLSPDRARPWQRIHAEDVADALVQQLSEDRYLNQAPYIRSGK